jgi:hypothetical protein
MLFDVRLLLLGGLGLVGCHTASDVAVKTFRVLDAPANYVRHKIDPETTTATVETTQASDVSTPGRPVAAPSPTPQRSSSTQRHAEVSTTAAAHTSRTTASNQNKPTSSGSPRNATGSVAQFPTAKPVPGKPGYVYSVDPKGGIVDVTGYKSGDKAKDPYTQQIFIVP